MMLTVAVFVTALACIVGWALHQRLSYLNAEADMHSREKELVKELEFERDWRIRETDLEWHEKLAHGSEGEVWVGRIKSMPHKGRVAIKKASI